MSTLARHTKANRDHFAKGCAPRKEEWIEWIRTGAVKGKLIAGEPWVDLDHFAANRILEAPAPKPDAGAVTGFDLLSRRKLPYAANHAP